MLFGNHRAHFLDGVDDVRADALGNLQRHRRLTVYPRETVGVFEGAVRDGDILERDYLVTTGLDGQVQDILNILEKPRHLDRETPVSGVHGAGRHQLVVAGDELQEDLR